MMIEPGGDGAVGLVGVVGVVFALYLVRAYGIAPFATLLALGAGVNIAGVLALRAISDLAIAGLLYAAITRWQARHAGRELGRLGQWFARARDGVSRGNVLVNFVAANYFLNTYLVFATIPTLPHARRQALAGALLGDLGAFAIDLAAILGLGAIVGGSRTTLSIAVTLATLGLAGVQRLVQRRLAWGSGRVRE
jgi:hypothetical protein